MRVGILAIQGDMIEHARVLEQLGVTPVLVRRPEDTQNIDGIIMPGGESTTMSLLLQRWGTFDVLKQRIADGMPAWGTCAGAILLAKEVRGKNSPRTFGLMDIAADRNAYGTQLDSFTANVKLCLPHTSPRHTPHTTRVSTSSTHKRYTRSSNQKSPSVASSIDPIDSTITSIVEAVFIRAPKLTPIQKKNVDSTADRSSHSHVPATHNSTVHVLATYNGNPVLLQQGRLLASAFHPELTTSTVIHQYFLDQCVSV